ncbi:protein ASYMMETRIC LEAVES 2-like [Punica granatum]|uniref:Protein ASYMMETRIC LEAVES 2-like n=1 Tax=Punica granatum TaxID=22663 RepID=A0A6P8C517_PUNGR|nr:protein ASYMMETRIC LEAVES 2-like [Punica granatum]
MHPQQNGGVAAVAGQPACASCKHQRKKCDEKCVLAPHFPAERKAEFDAAQKVFGVSNMSKMMKKVLPEQRTDVAESLIWEATCWTRDPVQGPRGEHKQLQHELDYYKELLAKFQCPQRFKPAPAPATALPSGSAPGGWGYPNTRNHSHSNGYRNEANGIITGNGASSNHANAVNFTGGHQIISNATAPATALTYVHDNGSSIIDPSPYGSANSNGQSRETVSHQEREIASSMRLATQMHPSHHRINGFNHQQGYYDFPGT